MAGSTGSWMNNWELPFPGMGNAEGPRWEWRSVRSSLLAVWGGEVKRSRQKDLKYRIW